MEIPHNPGKFPFFIYLLLLTESTRFGRISAVANCLQASSSFFFLCATHSERSEDLQKKTAPMLL